MNSAVPPFRLPDEDILCIVGEKLSELTGEWVLQPGPLLRGPGRFAVRVAATPHSESFRHIDLEFLMDVDDPEGTCVADCTSGLASDPELAARQAVGAWADTTACTALELMEQQGRLATRVRFAGWHTIAGDIIGWGSLAEDANRKQEWFADNAPWHMMVPEINSGLDRPALNGVRLFVGQGGESVSCEVRINGRRHEPASAALAAMDWPRSEKMSVARTFLLLVHPEE